MENWMRYLKKAYETYQTKNRYYNQDIMALYNYLEKVRAENPEYMVYLNLEDETLTFCPLPKPNNRKWVATKDTSYVKRQRKG